MHSKKYALVIADDPDSELAKFRGEFTEYKKAEWLYDGILYREGVTPAELRDAVFANGKFLPSIIVDNGRVLKETQFQSGTWRDNLAKFITLTPNVKRISFYVVAETAS